MGHQPALWGKREDGVSAPLWLVTLPAMLTWVMPMVKPLHSTAQVDFPDW
jgi:hypothetical protein